VRAYRGRGRRRRVSGGLHGLEGIVAKRRDSRYRSGRCRGWIKIKNMAHPAIERAMLIALSKRQQLRG
jgi:ATP-dependent DNA ligase